MARIGNRLIPIITSQTLMETYLDFINTAMIDSSDFRSFKQQYLIINPLLSYGNMAKPCLE
jgi:hypothetical protein